jgi:hypothetical protein
MNSITINPKYHCEDVYCHFLWDVDLLYPMWVCLANEWNAFINSQNDIVKSSKNLTTYKKKIPPIVFYEKVGLL